MNGGWNPDRRRFLRGVGTIIGGAALARTWTGRNFWDVPLRAAGGPYDPIPDPIAAGWTVEGSGATFEPAGTQVYVIDPSTAGNVFLNLFTVCDPTLFTRDIVLTPRVELGIGWTPDAETNIGFHVTINDGVHMIRAVLLDNGDGVSVSVGLISPNSQTGYSPPLPFNGSLADFTLTRMADGTALLRVPSKTPGGSDIVFTMALGDQPSSDRLGVPTIEFGTLPNVAGAGFSSWSTLGLPQKPNTFPIGLNIKQLRIRDTNDARLRAQLAFTLASGQAIDPPTSGATIKFSTPGGLFYLREILPGEFVLKGKESPARWTLTDDAKTRTGIERFDILTADGSIFFVDRDTSLPFQSFASVRVDLQIGNNIGTVSGALTEKPKGSGRWVL